MKKYGLFKRILAIALCVATLIGCFDFIEKPMKAEAASSMGVKVDNGFILKITMGTVTTDQVLYFCVKYYDTDNILRSHYILPTDQTLQEGYSAVEKKIKNSTADRKLPLLNTVTNSTTKSYEGLGTLFTSYNEAKALNPMATNFFYFEPDYKVSKIAGLKFFGKYKQGGKNEISIQNLSVYKVNYLYDIDMVDTFSSEYYIDFEGATLMTTKIQRTFSWSQTDTVFDFSSLKYDDGESVDMGVQYYSATYTDKPVSSLTSDYRTTSNSKRYTFEFTLADVYGAGAEYMNSHVTKGTTHDALIDGWLRECLVLTITYTDSEGYIHTSKTPVVLSAIYKAISEGGDVTKRSILSGFFQQGESIIFDVMLLDAKDVDLSSCNFMYGRDLAQKELGYTYVYDSLAKNISIKYGKLKETENDYIIVKSLVIYDGVTCSYKASVKDAFINATVTGNPLYYHMEIGKGLTIMEESEFTLQMANYTGTEDLNASKNVNGKFLITLKTDTPANSSTDGGINVTFRYKTYSGEEKESQLFVVRDCVEDYFGYWPAISKSKDENFSYAFAQGTQVGGTMSFIADIPNVDTFVGATFSLTTENKNDWQVSAIGIQEIKSMGRRTAAWIPVGNDNTYYSDRTISREMDAINISPTLAGPVLVEPRKGIYVAFTSGGSIIEENDINLDDYKYRMTYEEALQNLGFTKSRSTYVVDVAVAGDIVNGLVNEDCGSKNQFYFKLVFEDGASAYVLANQQLTSDGFTSGVTQSFRITTNRDMGKLTAIKILPWNQNDDGAFDKLKIDNIIVTKEGEGGLSLSWKIEINDWITIDYADKGAKDSGRGQKGRAENDLAQTYRVNSFGYAINMMFAVETLDYEDDIFDGRITFEIEYLDSEEILRTKNITDVVELFGAYSGKGGQKKTFQPVNDRQPFEGTEINRDYMLQEGHIDRFFVSLNDVKKLIRVNVVLKAVNSGTWRIGGISAYRVLTKGTRVINENNEYQYNGDVELVAQSKGDEGVRMKYVANGDPTRHSIDFNATEIEVDLENTWISSITCEPQSNDDSLNIYAFMSPRAKNIKNYEMLVSAKYSLNDDTPRETKTVLYADEKGEMFYNKGIPTSGLRTLRQIGLKVDSFDPQVAPCSHVIVEHIRSGVIIKTYYIDFANTDVGVSSGYYYMNTVKDTKHDPEKQTLMFMVSADSSYAKIAKDESDLAVSITYTSACDPKAGTLVSPNHFVSEMNVSRLAGGDIITMVFNQQYVKDITGITFIGQGGVANCIKIKSARVSTETVSEDKVSTISNIYSFGKEMSEFVTYSPRKMTLTGSTSKTSDIQTGSSKTVGALTIKLSTASGTSGLAGNAKLRMKIGYSDDYGQTKEMTLPDVSAYIASGSLNPGETATINILINGISMIRFIELEPYATGGGSASWSVGMVSAMLSIAADGVAEERYVNKTIVSGTPETIGFGNVKVQVVAYISKNGTTAKERRGFSSSSDASEGILMYTGNDILMYPTIEGSISGLKLRCQKIAVTAAGNTVSNDVTNNVLDIVYEGNKIRSATFTPTEAGDYRIVISSQEISSTFVEINVSVMENKENPAEDDPQPTLTSDPGTETLPPVTAGPTGTAEPTMKPINSPIAAPTATPVPVPNTPVK